MEQRRDALSNVSSDGLLQRIRSDGFRGIVSLIVKNISIFTFMNNLYIEEMNDEIFILFIVASCKFGLCAIY